MRIEYITVSDPRNYNTFDEMMNLWGINNRVEIAVQMHPGKVSPDTDRYNWIKEIVDKLSHRRYTPNFAIHVNCDWCDEICNGNMPVALEPLFNAVSYFSFLPIVGRIQLNMPQKTANNFNPQKLKTVIASFPDQKFILQYNERTKNAVDALHKTGANFSLLFDASGGRGIDAENWQSPVYPDNHKQGYSGGLSPENIKTNLDKIAQVAGKHIIWTDAEGKLKTDDKFDASRAKQYIQNVLAWEQKHR